MARKTNRQVKKINASQQHKAEVFRLMLLEPRNHGLTGKDKQAFEGFIAGLSSVELTNLSRQYRAPLETYYDSQGVTTLIAQDLMRRVQHLIRQQARNVASAMKTEIFKGDSRRDTSTVQSRIFEAYNKYRELSDMSPKQIRAEIDAYRALYEKAKTARGRQIVLEAAEGKDIRLTHKQFQELFGIGRKGRAKYRALFPTTKDRIGSDDQD